MFTREGIIIEKIDLTDRYRVHVSKHKDCSHCAGCKKWIDVEDVIEVKDAGEHRSGERVLVGMEEAKLLLMGFYVYMLPVIFLFAGIGVSLGADRIMGLPESPHRAVICGIVLMLSAFIYYSNRFNSKCRNGEIDLKILKVLEEE